MSTFFKTLIEQGFALVYIDDILLLSDSKEHMFQLIEQLHIISTKNNPKLALKNPFSCSPRSNSLDMKLVTIQLNQFIQKLQLFIKSLLQLAKVALMSFIGALNFYTKFIEKLHINLKTVLRSFT